MAPCWSVAKVTEYFQVSQYKAKQARKIKAESVILSLPSNKLGKPLNPDIVEELIKFYEDDETSRICRDKKDVVMVKEFGVKVAKPKLFLANLHELYLQLKEKTGLKVGFSKFCNLRPKWCIGVGAKGTHNVCVGVIHQNVKLMLAPLAVEFDSNSIMEEIVCDLNSKECMLHRCIKCPDKQNLLNRLSEILEDHDDDDELTFRQWTHTDRTELTTRSVTCDEFIEELADEVSKLTDHHFIEKAQSAHLKPLTETLESDTAVIILDFAENYSFLIQYSIQGFYWDNSQATLHPFAVYYKEQEKLNTLSICCFSDYMKHDTVTVHSFQGKEKIPTLKKIIYFSDGAASQYKNYKSLCNLCNHVYDFGVSADWNFFGTSHGKNVCDGIKIQ